MNKKIRMDDINNKLDELQKDMEEIWGLIDEMKSGSLKYHEKLDKKEIYKKQNKIIVVDDRSKWKREVYKKAKILVNTKSSFGKRSEVLHYIYNYMRRNYGIVWEQDSKEYKENLGVEYKPRTIDIVYDNEMYKSIFEAVLADLIANLQNKLNQEFSGLIEM